MIVLCLPLVDLPGLNAFFLYIPKVNAKAIYDTQRTFSFHFRAMLQPLDTHKAVPSVVCLWFALYFFFARALGPALHVQMSRHLLL